MGDYGCDSAGPGGFQWRGMGFDDDVCWIAHLDGRRFYVGFMDASFYESKREKGKMNDIRSKSVRAGAGASPRYSHDKVICLFGSLCQRYRVCAGTSAVQRASVGF